MEKVISTLVWAALIQGAFLAFIYLSSKKHSKLANSLLGLFLLVIIYEGTLSFLPFDHILGYSFYYFAFPEVKLLYPLLFFHYILEKIDRSEHYWKFLKIHYLLAAVVAGITLVNVFLFVRQGKQLQDLLAKETVELVFMIQQYYAFFLIIAVLIVAIREVTRYKKVVQKEYSDYEMLNINWLWRLIFAVVPIILVWGVDLTRIALGHRNSSDFELVTWGFVVIFIYFVSYQAYKHKNLFEGIEEKPTEVSDKLPKSKYKERASNNPVLGLSEDQEMIQRIKTHMETEAPYLDASLSIYQLARQLNIPVRELSLLINHKLNKHFFDFVNEYRVKKAMEILRDPGNNKITVLEILYEVGFNSKSSFNTVFKKYTGKTPTQYRKSNS